MEHDRARRRIDALDGLRAVAVLVVLVARTAPLGTYSLESFGIEIFFALSGYVNASLLASGEDWRRLFRQRALRMLPLYGIICLCLLSSSTNGLPWWSLATGNADVAMVFLPIHISRFDAWTPPAGLRLWVVCVELKALLLLPWLMRERRRLRVAIALSFLCRCAVGVECLLRPHSDGVVFAVETLFLCRMDGILLGAEAALQVRDNAGWLRALSRFAPALVLLRLVSAWIPVTPADLAYGVLILPLGTVAAVSLILRCAAARSVPLLSSAPLTWLGVIAYELYLFHGLVADPGPSWLRCGQALLRTLLLSGAAWYLVRRPLWPMGSAAVNHASRAVACLLFGATGAYLVRDAAGTPALLWCGVFSLKDFDSLKAIPDFLRNLMVPVPVVLGVSEILDQTITGNTWLVDALGYRLALVGSYLVAVLLAPRTRVGFVSGVVASLVLLWCTVVVHPVNPQVYDIYYAFFLIGFVGALDALRRSRGSRQAAPGLTAGFCLSMAELSRPFVIYMMPLLLGMALVSLRGVRRRVVVAFVLPLLLFSGGWHVYIAFAHGQLAWTSQGGFNLARAWPYDGPVSLIAEPGGQNPGSLLNTPEHLENNRRMMGAVVTYAVHHPLSTWVTFLQRVRLLLTPQTMLMLPMPADWPHPLHVDHWILGMYGPMVWLACLCVLHRSVRQLRRRRLAAPLEGPANQANVIAVLSTLFLACGEHGEQARFVLSVLPFFAVVVAAELDAQVPALAVSREVEVEHGPPGLTWEESSASSVAHQV
jgi:peptidoglycan/LPS O-acetylase OafA/YrhL